MSVFSEKMTELGYHRLSDSDVASYDVGGVLCDLVGTSLPTEYLEFLREYPVTGAFGVCVDCLGITPSAVAPDSFYDVGTLFGYCSIESQNVVELRRNPMGAWDFGPEFLAIGGNPFGNVFCLKLAGNDIGAVYYWEHDHGEGEECMFMVAPNFANFIERLQEEADVSQIVRAEPVKKNWLRVLYNIFAG